MTQSSNPRRHDVQQIPGIGWAVVDTENGRRAVAQFATLPEARRHADALDGVTTAEDTSVYGMWIIRDYADTRVHRLAGSHPGPALFDRDNDETYTLLGVVDNTNGHFHQGSAYTLCGKYAHGTVGRVNGNTLPVVEITCRDCDTALDALSLPTGERAYVATNGDDLSDVAVVTADTEEQARVKAVDALDFPEDTTGLELTLVPGGYDGDQTNDDYVNAAREALTRPEFARMASTLPGAFEQWGMVMTKSGRGDSDALTRANYDVILRELTALAETLPGDDPADYVREVTMAGPGGPVDTIAVRVLPDDVTTDTTGWESAILPAFRKAVDLASDMEAYPVLDEDLYGEYEADDHKTLWDDVVWRYYYSEAGNRFVWCNRVHDSGPDEQRYLDHVDSDDVFAWLTRHADDRDPETWTTADIERALRELAHDEALAMNVTPLRWWGDIRDDGVFVVLDNHAHMHRGWVTTVDRDALRQALTESEDPMTIPHDRALLSDHGLLGDREPLCVCGVRGCEGYEDNGAE